ncbi:ABC transporter permease [Halobacillus salinarum]|uniref:ABC transporter permease n=1 Tax=Halobacillus salinarum TaxID=2932257 RepID=A0ABY4EUW7_9BACI|nr:ABC transporter permease [Halobacillus salinarum]UOQ45941.1 ABC transporter permease [Halobacillus salinarum]
MTINQLILRNLKKNIKNYYLYVFALIFSVALYFAFVTLQYDPGTGEAQESEKNIAAVKVTSILLVAIVTVFLVYANSLFIKRRSKEIGLFQLIGMTKKRIFGILTLENLILYFGSLFVGIFVGFSFSKLIQMILFKLTGVEALASLHFSIEAFFQTILVFAAVYLIIMLVNYIYIKRHTILALFQITSSTENKVKNISVWEVIMGILGLTLIVTGYFVSSKLFEGDFVSMGSLFTVMLVILASVIIGTYFLYKGSVRFIANFIRKNKDGYLSINEVLSLSSIMFRMKSNALLLTIITTVSALAISFSSLSYISYYSAEKTAKENNPDDFSLGTKGHADEFEASLKKKGISYSINEKEVIKYAVATKGILSSVPKNLNMDPAHMTLPVVSDDQVEHIDLNADQVLFSGFSKAMSSIISFKDSGNITFEGQGEKLPRKYIGMSQTRVLSTPYKRGMPAAIVDTSTFQQLKENLNPKIQDISSSYYGINISNKKSLKEANELFQSLPFTNDPGQSSRYENAERQKENMGLTMFIVGFLGLTFLITSGCILYFKQMDESEEERPNYTILRKLGFTRNDLLRGIRGKQLFNFGIPLTIGLLHSYFAIRSGWFFFGTELWTPMVIVMVIYTILYSIFGGLSVIYCKKVIREAL